jgi:O-antigen ligase
MDPRGITTYEILTNFKRLVTLIMGYVVLANCLKKKEEVNLLYLVFLFAVILVGISTFRNGVLGGSSFGDFKRSSGPFGWDYRFADVVGAFLALFIPFILSFSLFAKKKIINLIGFLGLFTCLMGILVTYSRGSFFALGLALFIVILIWLILFSKRSKFLTTIIIFSLISLILSWRYIIPKAILTRMSSTIDTDGFDISSSLDESSRMRLMKYEESLKLFNTNLIWGIGFGQVLNLIKTDPHNSFIQIITEMGIFGFLAFIWFLWGIFRESKSLLKTEFAEIGFGFIGCLIAFVIVNMFYSNFFRDMVVGSFWVILGLLTSAKKFATSGMINT